LRPGYTWTGTAVALSSPPQHRRRPPL